MTSLGMFFSRCIASTMRIRSEPFMLNLPPTPDRQSSAHKTKKVGTCPTFRCLSPEFLAWSAPSSSPLNVATAEPESGHAVKQVYVAHVHAHVIAHRPSKLA